MCIRNFEDLDLMKTDIFMHDGIAQEHLICSLLRGRMNLYPVLSPTLKDGLPAFYDSKNPNC